MDDPAARRRLADLLRRDPLFEAPAILDARRRARGRGPGREASPLPALTSYARSRTAAAIALLRERRETIDLTEARSVVASLPLPPLPDQQRALDRLLAAIEARPRIEALRAVPDLDAAAADLAWRVLAAPHEEACALRERAFVFDDGTPRPASGPFHRTVLRLRADAPALVAHERAWLARAEDHHRPRLVDWLPSRAVAHPELSLFVLVFLLRWAWAFVEAVAE